MRTARRDLVVQRMPSRSPGQCPTSSPVASAIAGREDRTQSSRFHCSQAQRLIQSVDHGKGMGGIRKVGEEGESGSERQFGDMLQGSATVF